YFMLIKGAKGASFLSPEFVNNLTSSTLRLLLYTFLSSSVLLFLLNRIFKVDIIKVLVLFGTFALAMAFAGNDLVNFIGVPLAGYNSYELFIQSGNADPDGLMMNGLAGAVSTPTLLLLLSGVVMVTTLYLSKKARSVLETSVNLGRQDEGSEKFGSVLISRVTVRFFSGVSARITALMPERWRQSHAKNFDQTPFLQRPDQQEDNAPAFDMIRASVTLVVASSLIAIGTNLKLPLSTTYVTFMVFMGASLADGAWGRESAVYRVTGVLAVIGGWFFTALSAFTLAFVIALIFQYGGVIAIAIMLFVAAFVIYRTHLYHHRKTEEKNLLNKLSSESDLTAAKVVTLCSLQLKSFLIPFGEFVDRSLKALGEENLTRLNQLYQSFKPIHDKIQTQKANSSKSLDRISENELEAGHVYILVIDYLAEMAKDIKNILKLNLEHVDNNHKPLLPDQVTQLTAVNSMLMESYASIIDLFKNPDEDRIKELEDSLFTIVKKVREIRKQQIKKIKSHEVGTRNSVLIFSILGDLRNIILFSHRILRVFDELFLNPIEKNEFDYQVIKDELKAMRKEAKKIDQEPEKNSDLNT
ncbi:MAG: hypothetical protein KDC53_21915, partial [Saprospiraceae bacterium]|nr:hypothetical protein [Saprospiraceae bacterium]